MWDKLLKELGIEYIGPKDKRRDTMKLEEIIAYNKRSEKIFHDYLGEVWKDCWRVLCPQGRCVINVMNCNNSTHGMWMNTDEVRKRMFDIGFVQREEIIWKKAGQQHHSPMGSAFMPWGALLTNLIEHIIVFQKPGKREVSKVPREIKEKSRLTWKELRDWTDSNVWTMKATCATREGHIAPFPIEIPWRIIKLYTFVGDTVLDPFMGTGTSNLAARLLGRNSIGYDIDKKCMDIAKSKVMSDQHTLTEEQDSFEFIERGETKDIISIKPKKVEERKEKKLWEFREHPKTFQL